MPKRNNARRKKNRTSLQKKAVDHSANESSKLYTLPLDDLRFRLNKLVFQSNEPIVIALNGRWGEGKTTFWKQLIRDEGMTGKVGYVSVFGANSTSQIREKVIYEALRHRPFNLKFPIPDIVGDSWAWCFDRSGPLKNILVWLSSNLQKALKSWPEYFFGLFRPNRLSIQLIEESLLKPNWILCLDDIERLSKTVELDELFGYIDELRNERKIKIVLIYSEDKFGKKSDTYKLYRDKVIDRQIPFAPNTIDLVNMVFEDCLDLKNNSTLQGEIIRRCDILKLRNIRLLFKVKNYYKDMVGILPQNADKSILLDKLYSLMLFVFAYHNEKEENGLNIKYLLEKNESDFSGFLEEDKNSDIVRLLQDFGYTNTDAIDKLLMHFVETDIIDEALLTTEYANLDISASRDNLYNRFSDVWKKHFHGTLRDNEDVFCAELESATKDFLPYISIPNLDGALETFSELGRDSIANEILDTYIEQHGDSLDGNFRESLFKPIKYLPLLCFLEKVEAESKVDKRPLSELIQQLLDNNYATDRDKERISNFKAKEIADYLISIDIPHFTNKLIRLKELGILLFDEVFEEIEKSSSISEVRMKHMGLTQADA
jgi:hypothetical protein